jgi:fatty acid synthase subunit alpha, fungi type
LSGPEILEVRNYLPQYTVAKEVPAKYPLPILDIAYRSRQLNFRRNQISQWLTHEQSQLREEIKFREWQGEPANDEYFNSRVVDIEKETGCQEKNALATYGMLEDVDARIFVVHWLF